MKFDLNDNIVKKICRVFARYPQLESVIIYGSRALGNFKNGSDIDLTIKGCSLNIDTLTKIANDLDELLTPYKFDLSSFSDIDNLDLKENIKKVGMTFYSKDLK